MILSDRTLPERYYYRGKYYDFRSDFRAWIKVEALLFDGDVPADMKPYIIVRIVFGKNAPPLRAALRYIFWFYRCGAPVPRENSGGGEISESRRAYDYDYDADLIYAAFMQNYGIDLYDTEYLHWWKFRALFKGLKDTRINDIMGVRQTDITDNMSEERKDSIITMQEIYELPVSLYERRRINMARSFLDG